MFTCVCVQLCDNKGALVHVSDTEHHGEYGSCSLYEQSSEFDTVYDRTF